MLKKKIWPNFQRIVEVFIQKIFNMLSNIWVWDPGVKKAPDPGSGSATLPLGMEAVSPGAAGEQSITVQIELEAGANLGLEKRTGDCLT